MDLTDTEKRLIIEALIHMKRCCLTPEEYPLDNQRQMRIDIFDDLIWKIHGTPRPGKVA